MEGSAEYLQALRAARDGMTAEALQLHFRESVLREAYGRGYTAIARADRVALYAAIQLHVVERAAVAGLAAGTRVRVRWAMPQLDEVVTCGGKLAEDWAPGMPLRLYADGVLLLATVPAGEIVAVEAVGSAGRDALDDRYAVGGEDDPAYHRELRPEVDDG